MTKQKILIVEDDADARNLYKKTLTREEYEIVTTESAEEAEEILHDTVFDVILADNVLPGKTGLDVLKNAKKKYPDTIRLLITGFPDLGVLEEAINEAEIFRYLSKPVRTHDLQLTVKTAVEYRKLMEQNKDLLKNLENKVENKTKELSKSEERYRSLFEGADDQIFVLDENFRYTMVNESALKSGGFKLEDAQGKTADELFPHDAEFYNEQYSKVFEAKSPLSFERAFPLPDGLHWFSVTLSPIIDENGEVTGLTGISRDITNRKKMEEKEKQFSSTMEFLSNSAFGFVELGADDDIYTYIGEQLKNLVDDAVIAVSHYDSETKTMIPKFILGLGKNKEKVYELLGDVLPDKPFPVTDEAKEELLQEKLNEVPGGLYGLLFERISKKVCKTIEKMLNVNKVYAIGMSRKDRLLGHIVLLTGNESSKLNKEAIETFVYQASAALEKRKVEDLLRESEKRLNDTQRLTKMGGLGI